jgi:hypothetical protein
MRVAVSGCLLSLAPLSASAAGQPPYHQPVPRMANGLSPWAAYDPAPRSRKMELSGAARLGLRGLDFGRGGDREGGVLDSFPATGVPKMPAGFAPDVIVNQDRSAQPHNETSVAANPKNPYNLIVGANDYSLGFGSSGTYATFDGGGTWYGAMQPFPQVKYCPLSQQALGSGTCPGEVQNLDVMDGGGDPAVAFDHDGVAYYAEINFKRVGCISGVFVFRSYNGGQTWSRPLYGPTSTGDTKQNGDGIVALNPNDNDCSTFFDKEMIGTGPRPSGATLVPATDTAHLSSDRLYVSYSGFHQVPPVKFPPASPPEIALDSPTFVAYSDDQGRHWSVTNGLPLATSGYAGGSSAAYCAGWGTGWVAGPGTNTCGDSQGSDVQVDPRSGKVYVSFNNGDNSDQACNAGATPPMTQILVVSSADGGATWSAPHRAACVSPSLPSAPTASCPASNGLGAVSNLCFRVPIASTGSNVAVNPVDGSVHVIWMSNVGGTNWTGSTGLTDVDIFTSASTDGGVTFGKPVRVNQDSTKVDQFFPWGRIGPDGTFYAGYLDRSQDPAGNLIGETMATSHDSGATWTTQKLSTGLFDGNKSFRAGAFMGDYTGLAASSLGAFAAWPDTRRAGNKTDGDNPLETWSDIVGGATYPLMKTTSQVTPPPLLLPQTEAERSLPFIFLLGLAAGAAVAGRVFRRRARPA